MSVDIIAWAGDTPAPPFPLRSALRCATHKRRTFSRAFIENEKDVTPNCKSVPHVERHLHGFIILLSWTTNPLCRYETSEHLCFLLFPKRYRVRKKDPSRGPNRFMTRFQSLWSFRGKWVSSMTMPPFEEILQLQRVKHFFRRVTKKINKSEFFGELWNCEWVFRNLKKKSFVPKTSENSENLTFSELSKNFRIARNGRLTVH